MKPEQVKTIEDVGQVLKTHFDDDNYHFDNINTFIKRMEPFLIALEDSKTVKMRIKADTTSIVFYAKSALTIGSFLAGLGLIIKYIFHIKI
jgi:hypothetical protein